MGTRLLTFVAFAVALVVAPASANPAATKQRVAMNTVHESFTFVPLKVGTLKRDSGSTSCAHEVNREVMRDGQQGFVHDCAAWTFAGKLGKLVVHNQFTWVAAGDPYSVATGTWIVVRGTGQYAGVTGRGRSAHVGTSNSWDARYEGLLTSP